MATVTLSVSIPEDFTLDAHERHVGDWPGVVDVSDEDFILGTTALLEEPECSERMRLFKLIDSMAALLESVGVALTGRVPEDFRVLPELAERTVTRLRLAEMRAGLIGSGTGA